MIARIAIVLALAVGGCTVERQVLADDDAPLTTCEQVWLGGAPGDSCDLPGPCTRDSPNDPMCCFEYAYCRTGTLVLDTTCNPDCSSCADDHACVPGAAICTGTSCEPCPPPDNPNGMNCQACPEGWTYLTRNGCQTCECSPASECDPFAGGPCVDPNGVALECYPGQRFADPGCAPDDAGCFANVCSEPGCTGPAPLGCFTTCDPAVPACNQCATTACECDPATGGWVCTQVCIDDIPLSLTCFL